MLVRLICMHKKLLLPILVLILLSACDFNSQPQEQNYTVPSWTLFQRALVSGKTVQEARTLLVPKNVPYSINTTIHGDPTSQMGITWFTNANVLGGVVQVVEGRVYNHSGFSNAREIQATHTAVDNIVYVGRGCETRNRNRSEELIELTGFPAGTRRSYTSNKALITGLNPNTVYSYRVGKEGAWSDIGHFMTAPAGREPFEFIYITDTQSNTDEMFAISRRTLEAAKKNTPNARFVLITGDLVQSSAHETAAWEWEQFFATKQHIWLQVPIVPVKGNHDRSPYHNMYHHFNTDTSFNRQQTDVNAKTTMEGTVYSFVYGDALFLILNFEDHRQGETYFAAKEEWMRTQIAAHADVRWRIAAFHKPLFTGARHQGALSGRVVRERFAPVFQELGISLALQGHDHAYQVIGPIHVDGTNFTRLTNAISNQTFVTPTPTSNANSMVTTDATGIRGGTFDVSRGTLYFTNNSAGKKKYYPRSREEMDEIYHRHGVRNYFDLFNRFAQTGEPTFSRVRIATYAIDIATYTVCGDGKATLFEEIRLIKN